MKLLGGVDQTFIWVSDNFIPTNDGTKNQVFVTSSYDATSHFETATDEVLVMYEKIMGKPIDLTISAEPNDLESQE